jgi:hypothetical protein
VWLSAETFRLGRVLKFPIKVLVDSHLQQEGHDELKGIEVRIKPSLTRRVVTKSRHHTSAAASDQKANVLKSSLRGSFLARF